ncbi:3-isopropylmalate dehydrogenase [Pontiella desulfatans]|uniref:3-isopropylmalate dehydrogenase n=1 Tax=Pontiella desulfatans TaxID=2750659 RepID=A0A6C2TY63_PONDE|nr:3-isopropylmalate dehydrogenase [Pontiella desulfatans]VGO12291.1 3-isopropylmalate dehydrogenase [Pontiella desulfatans]
MSKTYKITLLPGDGIGPEVIAESVKVLDAVSEKAGFALEYTQQNAGGAAIDAHNDPMPDSVVETCKASDAVLLGAVGGPKWDALTGAMRPESGLLKIRKELGAFANLRPVTVPASLAENSPLRPETVAGLDLFTVRELTGGIYFGQPVGTEGEGDDKKAWNTMVYSVGEIKRVARVAFEWARKRRNKVTSVDKANVLEVSRLWRDTVIELHQAEYSDVELDHLYIDNAAMQMVVNPRQFDVILTGNIFGDILSDASATLGGSLGLLPSASVGGPVGIFEPVHGSAPDIAGQGKANPIAMILSAAMMLDTLGEEAAANAIRAGVEKVLNDGYRSGDLWREGNTLASTTELGDLVKEAALAAM